MLLERLIFGRIRYVRIHPNDANMDVDHDSMKNSYLLGSGLAI